ncbi:acidic leucine-rich nuclear phosphoprotein 32 family member A-like [Orbicella faveolata]|uniref:acidic leucine-rich nuclear phosphoprotein 32 family member A-like n=1 Tax=Orbicella faveolata TaxID=48498 RepID=UPI0009E590E5|nr:acidic leucine-rich nuclear phosphoprotein 32 family member A-like [Orbicella faveolata]
MEEGGSNEENVKDEEKEKEAKEEHEEGQEKEDDSRSSEEEEEVEDDERDNDPWNPLRRKKGEDLKEPFMKEVQQFLDRGKTQDYAGNAAFNTQLPASR